MRGIILGLKVIHVTLIGCQAHELLMSFLEGSNTEAA